MINKGEIEARAQKVCKQYGLQIEKYLAKGFSSLIFQCKDGKGKKIVIKIERNDSPRKTMIQNETQFLQHANQLGIGPKWIASDFDNRCVLMESVVGTPIQKWVLSPKRTPRQLDKTISLLLKQARLLDQHGIDHGQLAGRGHNILVTPKGLPVIIDFEKASNQRKTHNYSQLYAFLFSNPHSKIAQCLRKRLKNRIPLFQQKGK